MMECDMEVMLERPGQRDVRVFGDTPLFGSDGVTVDVMAQSELGRYGEDLAAWYLSQYGTDIVERNWRCSLGEVDIVARDEGGIVLVEVKTRRAQPFDEVFPEVSVSHRKRKKYELLAMAHLGWHADVDNVRFDVIAVKVATDYTAYIRHIYDAFQMGM